MPEGTAALSTARKTVDCYNCGASDHTHFLAENGFDLVKCAGCGLLYIRERPSEAEIAAATASGRHKGKRDLHVNVQYNTAAQSFYQSVLPQIFPQGLGAARTWLDVGCGYGEFLEALEVFGQGKLTLTGSEPNLVKQKAAQERGRNVTYFDLEGHAGRYDVVSLMNVYSHLPDPYAFLGDLAEVVAPGGHMLVQTGDVTGLTGQTILRPAGLPDHLTFVTQEVLDSMLTRLGLEPVRVVKYPSLPFTPARVAKEMAKLVLPGRTSFLRNFIHWKTYQTGGMFMLVRKPA